jgi:S-formylglutathione hydrolase FrmB
MQVEGWPVNKEYLLSTFNLPTSSYFYPMKFLLLLTLNVTLMLTALSGPVDTVSIYSHSMRKSINCVVIKPAVYKKKKLRFPVVYLLHGYSGSYNNWIKRVPELQQLASQHRVLIVCPDGGFSSWYMDSPVDSSYRYETHVAQEVVAFIDSSYRTIAARKARAITGLSMGGHGGLFLAWRNSNIFGAAGSMSGGVDLNASRQKFDISKRIGDTVQYAANWKNYSVINMIERYPPDSLRLIIDCGTEDFFYNINHALHLQLLRLKIPHDYIERPGKHDWHYWRNAVEYQLLFFRKYFDEKTKP